MRSSNPAMTGRIFEQVSRDTTATGVMTINGTINKVGLMLLLVIAAAAYTWNQVTGVNPGNAGMYAIGGAIGGFITALVTVFRPRSSPISGPIYAILEGLFLGAITAVINSLSAGADWPVVISFKAAVIAMLFAGSVGVFFGFYPAWRASRLEPIDALRYE